MRWEDALPRAAMPEGPLIRSIGTPDRGRPLAREGRAVVE